MKSLFDKLMAQECPKHGSPLSFIYQSDLETNESRMICDECINPQIEYGKLISLRKAFKFLQEKQTYKNQSFSHLTSLWQQFKHNSIIIYSLIKDLEDQMEHLLNYIKNKLITRTLNDEFLTETNIESVGQSIGSQINQDIYGQFTLKQEQEGGQQEQYSVLQINNILEGQRIVNNNLSTLISQIQNSIEQNNNMNETKVRNIQSIDVTNYQYETSQTIKLNQRCYWISFNCKETEIVAAVGKSLNFYKLSQQGQWIEGQVLLKEHTEEILRVKYNHNSTLIASCSGKENLVILWSKQLNGQWSILDKLNGPNKGVYSICFNHDSSLLALGCSDGITQIHNRANGKWEVIQSITEHKYSVVEIFFNNDSTNMVTGSSDKVIFWEQNNQGKWTVFQTLIEYQDQNYVKSVYFNQEFNQLILRTSRDSISILAVDNDKKWNLMHTFDNAFSDKYLIFNKQSNMVVSTQSNNWITIWKINQERKWQITQSIHEHTSTVTCTIINSDSSMIVSGSEDGTIRVHKLKITQ